MEMCVKTADFKSSCRWWKVFTYRCYFISFQRDIIYNRHVKRNKVGREVGNFSIYCTESEPAVVVRVGMKLFVKQIVWIGREMGMAVGRINLLILMNLKRLLYRVNIHKCLLSNHGFIGLSCRFSNIFEFIVAGHPACFHYHFNHLPLGNHSSKTR